MREQKTLTTTSSLEAISEKQQTQEFLKSLAVQEIPLTKQTWNKEFMTLKMLAEDLICLFLKKLRFHVRRTHMAPSSTPNETQTIVFLYRIF